MTSQKHILFVDDEPRVLDSLRRVLREHCRLWQATCLEGAEAAWERMLDGPFDVVVTDIRMPHTTGLELLERMQADDRTKNIPVILLTGLSDHGLKRKALDLGATDLLNKPIEPEDLLARLRSAVRLKACQDELRAANRVLEEKIEERTEQLVRSHLDIVWRLAKAAEFRDEGACNHVIRVGCASRAVATAMGMNRRFVEDIFLAAPLHDIGKIAIPDSVLLKPGRLTAGEWRVMKDHCRIGAQILREDSKVKSAFLEWRGACFSPGAGNPFLEMATTIALSHHERWDGSGYPQELAGGQIPVEARIVAIADVFDAICSRRPYKRPCPEEVALEIIGRAVGSHFDPEVYEAFNRALSEIRAARERFADCDPPDPVGADDQEEERELEATCRRR